MATGFTPQTPSTDEVIRSLEHSASMGRRAAIYQERREDAILLHHEAGDKEMLLQRMKDAKLKGHRVFGNDGDSSAEKKALVRNSDRFAQDARLQILLEVRPPPFPVLVSSWSYT